MQTIHDRAQRAATQFKKSEIEMINIIQEIDEKKAFFEKKYTSTFTYCVGFLKLSDNLSLDFIAIARVSKKVPELKRAIQNELLTSSKARRITSVITKENASHWLNLAQNVSKEKLEKEIAKVRPQVLTPEKAKYVTENRLKLELGISEEFMKNLKRAQEIFCQKSKSYQNFEATLGWALKEIVKREDPLNKAERAMTAEVKRFEKETLSSSSSVKGKVNVNANVKVKANFNANAHTNSNVNVNANFDANSDLDSAEKTNLKNKNEFDKNLLGPGRVAKRIPLDVYIKHVVYLRDEARCTFKDETGERCTERKWLHLHHKLPVSKGGNNQPQNLVSLCSGHHDLVHQHQH
jgi:hypothetical protein